MLTQTPEELVDSYSDDQLMEFFNFEFRGDNGRIYKLLKVRRPRRIRKVRQKLSQETIWKRIFQYRAFYRGVEAKKQERIKELIKENYSPTEAERIASNEREGI